MIWLIVLAGFFLRTYRIDHFMGFWFDQGRDALVVWNLLHHHELFLIGPTTGIEGIFLGPFYYYLIAPFYALGHGNPVYPAVFLALLNSAAIYLIYALTKRYAGKAAGLTSAMLFAFSSQLIGSSRWLSNPTPLPFFALLALWSLVDLAHSSRKTWLWPLLGLAAGLGLQLEAASATFFLPVIAIVLVVYRKDLVITWRKLGLLVGAFVATLLPQIVFNIRNHNILVNAFYTFLFSEKSFQAVVTNFYSQRLAFYFDTFTNKFILEQNWRWPIVLVIITMAVLIWKQLPHKFFRISLLWWLLPAVVLLFYHGNHGYVWDYYFTGVYPVLCIIIGTVLGVFFSKMPGLWRLAALAIVVAILYQNLLYCLYYYQLPGAPFINLPSEVAAVDWIYEDAGNTPFNTDEYVPPMIPYAYEYILLWRGQTKYGRAPSPQLVKRLYILREPDPGHQTLLDTWMTRQAGIASVDLTRTFGSITAERRVRFDVNAK